MIESLRDSYNIIMPKSQVKSSTLFQSFCGHLASYGHQHHCERQIPSCIHDTSILLLDRLGAYVCVSTPLRFRRSNCVIIRIDQ